MPEFREPDRSLLLHDFVDPAVVADTNCAHVRVALNEPDVATRTGPIRIFLEHPKHLPESFDNMLRQAQEFRFSPSMDEYRVARHESITPAGGAVPLATDGPPAPASVRNVP